VEEIIIDSFAFDSYRTVAQADAYFAGAFHAANWEAATDLNKAQALITATRLMDRQRWKAAYDTQAERLAVQKILDACCEIALALIDGGEIQTSQTTAQTLQTIKAGSVSLTYFRGAEGSAHRFPTIINELLRDYLAGSGLVVSGVSTGTGGTSVTETDLGFTGGV
jgi:hypothetical protein